MDVVRTRSLVKYDFVFPVVSICNTVALPTLVAHTGVFLLHRSVESYHHGRIFWNSSTSKIAQILSTGDVFCACIIKHSIRSLLSTAHCRSSNEVRRIGQFHFLAIDAAMRQLPSKRQSDYLEWLLLVDFVSDFGTIIVASHLPLKSILFCLSKNSFQCGIVASHLKLKSILFFPRIVFSAAGVWLCIVVGGICR